MLILHKNINMYVETVQMRGDNIPYGFEEKYRKLSSKTPSYLELCEYANRVHLDEADHSEQPHLDLHYSLNYEISNTFFFNFADKNFVVCMLIWCFKG